MAKRWAAIKSRPYSRLRFVARANGLHWVWAQGPDGEFGITWQARYQVTNDGTRSNLPVRGSLSHGEYVAEFNPGVTVLRGTGRGDSVMAMPVEGLGPDGTARMDIVAWSPAGGRACPEGRIVPTP